VSLVVWLSSFAAAPDVRAAGADDKINYDTARFDRKLLATRAAGRLVVDGALDEAAWRDAPVANNFIQNDPNEGDR